MGQNHHDILPAKHILQFTDKQNACDLPFYYHFVTHEKTNESEYDYSHYHDSFEIHYIIKGIHEMKIANDRYVCVPGEVLCIAPNEIHYSMHTAPSQTWRIMIENQHLKSLGINFDTYTLPSKIEDSNIAKFMSEMFEDALSKQAYNQIKCYGITLQMMIYLFRNHAKPLAFKKGADGNQLDIISYAIRYIENNYHHEDFSFRDLANTLGYSPSYFSRIFTKATGTSAVKYLIKTRCIAAKKLLNNNYTVAEACERCGFSNPSYFIKTYKKVMGHLPSDDKNPN